MQPRNISVDKLEACFIEMDAGEEKEKKNNRGCGYSHRILAAG